MTVRTKYRVDLTLSHKKSGSPRRFCQEGQLDKIAPSRRHLDICKNTKIPNTLQIFPRKFSKNHQKYRHHIAHQAHTAHIAHKNTLQKESRHHNKCRLSTRKGSHILYFSTAEAQTYFIFHLSSFIFLTTPSRSHTCNSAHPPQSPRGRGCRHSPPGASC